MSNDVLGAAPLGKRVGYRQTYAPELLFAVPRMAQRASLDTDVLSKASGVDVWNGYELSWLDSGGKPVVAHARFTFDCNSPNLIESKSFKLYLNSFNAQHFESPDKVQQTLAIDLAKVAEGPVRVDLKTASQWGPESVALATGHCLDSLDVKVDRYDYCPGFLRIKQEEVIEEELYSDLLKSNCLVTGQPDWGTVTIRYRGPRIDHEGLLRYIISFRDHNEFHEHCVERIFVDLMVRCAPERLFVEANYTRRGGLDINPVRAFAYPATPRRQRLFRQ